MVGAVERDHERHRLLDRHRERERQQHDERVLRAEARQDADDDAEQDRRQDHPPQAELHAELLEQELPGQESSLSIGPCGMSDWSRTDEQQVGRECATGERHDRQRLAARAHDPERGEQRKQQAERQAEPVQRGDECDGDQHHADALAERVSRAPTAG
jgi:hypothetical protein